MHQLSRYAIAAACAAAMSLVPLQAQNAAQNQPQNVPTPRTADGHPDLSGMWGGGGGGIGGARVDEKGNLVQLTRGRPCSTS